MIDWLDNHLIPEWRKLHKRWSVQFATLPAIAVGAMVAQPSVIFTVLNYLPVDTVSRAIAAVCIALFVWFAPTLLVALPQRKLQESADAGSAE
jgi:hypothetical protein